MSNRQTFNSIDQKAAFGAIIAYLKSRGNNPEETVFNIKEMVHAAGVDKAFENVCLVIAENPNNVLRLNGEFLDVIYNAMLYVKSLENLQ
jgi:hypothetical protein